MWACLATKRCIVSGCAKLAGNGERRTNTGNAGKMIPLLISRFRNILANLKSTTVQHFLYISSINLDFLIRAISTKTPKQLRNNLICLHTPVALLASKLRIILDISDSNAETLTEAVQCTDDDQERSGHMYQVGMYSRRKLLAGEGTSSENW